jgi:hypothetical protein
MPQPVRTVAAGPGVQMRRAVKLPAATVVGGWKNTQIYIIKRAKKMCSGKCNS